MSDGFTRTATGVVGSRYFYAKPLVWVEGSTDIYFYEPIMGELNCVLKPFHGEKNAKALIDGLKNGGSRYPFAVILDGDYGILERRKSVHRWVVYLRRYSFENYLWEKDSLNRSCLKHAQCGEIRDEIGDEFDRIERDLKSKLLAAVELDVAARANDDGIDVLPDRIDILLGHHEKPDVCPVKVSKIIRKAKKEIQKEALKTAQDKVSSYTSCNNFSWLLSGHLLFGVIQRVFTQNTARIRGKKVLVNNDTLTQLLSEMVWRRMPSDEHRRLRRKLVSVVRELNSAAGARP